MNESPAVWGQIGIRMQSALTALQLPRGGQLSLSNIMTSDRKQAAKHLRAGSLDGITCYLCTHQ